MLICNLAAQNHSFSTDPHYAIIDAQNIKLPINQVTVECWIKPNTIKNWVAPLGFITDNGSNESGFAFAYYNDKMRFMLKTETMRGDEWNYNPGANIEMNQWSHIAGVYDGEFIKMYLNGNMIDSKPTRGAINWEFLPHSIHIGAFKDFNESSLFDGRIDEVRIWANARSTEEIQSFKNKKIDVSDDNLLAYYNFDQIDKGSIVVPDLSKYKLDGKFNIPANKETLVQSGAMIEPVVTDFQLISPSSFQLFWECPKNIYFDHFIIDISTDKSFKQIIKSVNTTKNTYLFEDIQGGSIIYLRIKGFSKDIGYTSYSTNKEINEFRTGLSVEVTSLIDNNIKSHHFLINNNQLNTNFIGLPTNVQDVRIDFKLNNEKHENIRTGIITITGPSKVYKSEFLSSSDITLFNLEPGKYKIDFEWGSIDQKEVLHSQLNMEVRVFFVKSIYFKLTIIIILIGLSLFFFKHFTIINRHKLILLNSQGLARDTPSDWMEPNELKQKAILIKERIINEKLYLDPKFNLKALALKVNLPHYQVSRILNDYYRSNFNDFINELRVKEFVEQLNKDETDHIKTSALAFNCGFYSESTFFRAFKKFMKQSPKQYIDELRK